MKQVTQNYRSGELKVVEVPSPQIRPSCVKVKTFYSMISAGTEKTKVDTAKMSLLQKARSRPDLVKKVLEKAKKEGILSTFEMVNKKLSDPIAMGYSAVGVVEEVGEWVEGILPGDIVACAGAGSANHAEYNVVPSRLVSKCPPGTPLDQAALTTIGSIALQGVRQTQPLLGEKVVVIGLGLLGQITAKLLELNGCEVFATDLDPWKLEIAKKWMPGIKTAHASSPELSAEVSLWTKGRGADAVVITASTSSDSPIEQAGHFSREKGRVVIVGAIGTKFPREPYYLKEIDIRIARSYGPGRYDPMYEELGLDYPFGYVRFTEQRNMETFLGLLSSGKLDLNALVTHRFPIAQASEAFALLSNNSPTNKYLAIALDYTKPTTSDVPARFEVPNKNIDRSKIQVGFIGIGNYATSQILPRLTTHKDVALHSISSASGMTASLKGQQHGFSSVIESTEKQLEDPQLDLAFIVSRHDSHAKHVVSALRHNKHVFVEKPLCLTHDELNEITRAYNKSTGSLTVGFNRRFSVLIQETKDIFPGGAHHILYRVNAGPLPPEHWLKMPEVGGGRILGEGCHFIDLASYLGGAPIASVSATASRKFDVQSPSTAEDVHIHLTLENGSTASIVYLTSGNMKLPKEMIEVHGGGNSVVIDDFTSISINGGKAKRLSKQDKGQSNLLRKVLEMVRTSGQAKPPITVADIFNSTEATLAVVQSLAEGRPISLAKRP